MRVFAAAPEPDMMRLLAVAFMLVAARPAFADCVSVTDMCACVAAPVIAEGTITATDGTNTTVHVGTVHRGPHATAADESWLQDDLVFPSVSTDSVGAPVYVFGPRSRKLRNGDGTVTCTSEAPPLTLNTEQFLDLAFADNCQTASYAAGLKERECNDTGIGCTTGGTAAAGLIALLARRRSRRRSA